MRVLYGQLNREHPLLLAVPSLPSRRTGMGSVWERLLPRPRSSQGAEPVPPSVPGDRKGIVLYADFTDCLEEHKGHAFAGIAAVALPWSIYKKSITPLVIGAIAGIAPDILYANWRCDDKYKVFMKHLAAVQQDYGLTQPQQPGVRQ